MAQRATRRPLAGLERALAPGEKALFAVRAATESGGLVEPQLGEDLRPDAFPVHRRQAAHLEERRLVVTLAAAVALVHGELVTRVLRVQPSHDLVTRLLGDDRRGSDRG